MMFLYKIESWGVKKKKYKKELEKKKSHWALHSFAGHS